jgi:hypothetical protein
LRLNTFFLLLHPGYSHRNGPRPRVEEESLSWSEFGVSGVARGFSIEIEGLEGVLNETEQSEGAGVMILGLEAKDEDAAVPWEKVVPTPPVEACCNAKWEKSWGSEGLTLSGGVPSMVLLVFRWA